MRVEREGIVSLGTHESQLLTRTSSNTSKGFLVHEGWGEKVKKGEV